jgi:hypothetical protein
MLFLNFLKDGSVLSLSDLAPINANEYLGGLLDFTGELARYVRACVRACVCVCVMYIFVYIQVCSGSSNTSRRGVCAQVP